MLLLVGLGNPGPEYQYHRHNVGFMAVEAIAETHGFTPPKSKFRGAVREGLIAGQKVLMLRPLTYMNRSGPSVQAAASFYKIPLEQIVVFHDELDLEPGIVRVKAGGGNAGHNGLKSISQTIGNDYRRVRIGIGHPGEKHLVTPYVLGNFAREDLSWLEAFLHSAARDIDHLVKGDDIAYQQAVSQPN